MAFDQKLVAAITEIVGVNGVITNVSDMAPYLHEERGLAESSADLVARPANTAEVAAVVRACAETKTPMVPVGGSTGLTGGTLASGGVLVATDRLNKIIEVDALNSTMTVETGCILADLQTAAADQDCLFPLSLGAEGSCRIGGNLSTNAGGIGVLRYGNTRDLVLGLEVVLPSGEIWDGLNALRKDNTGYDLKQLFIGAEGTLGIITKAVLKLFPAPKTTMTVLAALPELTAILNLFEATRQLCGDRLTAFELISRIAIDLGVAHIPGVIDPFENAHPCYALVELTSPRANDELRTEIETVLEKAFEDGIVTDAVFAESDAQRQELWKIREEIPAAQTREGASIKHDISVPVSQTVAFITEASKQITQALPGIRPCPFGHIGDGNIHFNLTQPAEMTSEDFMAQAEALTRIVYDLVVEMKGSISAEHGIGAFKRKELAHYASATKIDLMRSIKQALDPDNIMNPGKIV
ncbi:MAG: FAD-binding oxidoreductase [Rhodospirillaceae bacterium]|jgi:FAD/FMN-containing dehydrogenase|nr:FAD-binding oxidoreductase [Rhodospirillaceae bacterium]